MARSKGVVIPISAEDNSARAFESVNAQVAKLRAQVAELRALCATLRGEGGGAAEALGAGMHSATTQVQATSAALRTIEGNPGIRAMERFLITIPGVGAAMQAIFPAIGMLAIAGVVEKIVEKFIEMRTAALGAAEATRKAFQEAHDKATVALDDTQLQNDKLQEQIDKIEKRPNNGLKAALDDAKKSCDQLIVTLNEAKKSYMELLKTNSVGWVAGIVTGAGSTGQQEKELGSDQDKLIAQARKFNTDYLAELSGAKNPADINALADKRVKQIHDLYDPQIASMQAEAKRLQDAENVYNSVGLLTSHTNNSKKIANVQGTGQTLSDQEAQQLADVQHASLQGKVAEDGKGPKSDHGAEELAKRVAEAQARVAEAQTKAAEQAAQSAADGAKNKADLALAQLDEQHKRQLVSDKDYYAQKLAIQTQALDAEEAANYAKQGALGDQIRGTIIKRGKESGDPVAQIDDNAKIIDLQTQVNALEAKRADIVEKRKKLEAEAGTEAFASAKKEADEALKLAAAVEAIRGGSTTARTTQSDKTYQHTRQDLVVQGASPAELADADYQHSTADADIGLKGAEDTEKNKDTGISTARNSVKYQESSGQISQVQARQELIDLDKQEADAMQPVLAAYEQLAALNVDGAAEKVAQLKEKIAELKAPVSEVASEIRGQLDSAFEELFVNIDKGKKAWASFKKSTESDVMKDTYKQFVEPGLQAGMGAITGAFSGAGKSKTPTPSSAIGGLLGKILPGLPKVAGGGSSPAQVTIINQSSTPVQGTATSSSSSDMTDQLTGPVLQIMLKDLESSGPFAQALSIGGLLTV